MPITNAYSYAEYLALPAHSQPWLVQPLIPVGGLVCLHGHAKTRKSFLAIQLARDICNGYRFLGFDTRPGRVLYVQLDTPRSLWQLRFQRLERDRFGLTPEGGANLYIADTEHTPHPFHILLPQVQQWLYEQIATIKPDLVVFDVIRKLFKGSDNDSDLIEEVLATVKHVCRPAAVLMIAHSKKAKADFDSGTIGEIRGSSAQGASYDTIMRLSKATKQKGPTLAIEGRATEDVVIQMANRDDLLFDLAGGSLFESAVRVALEREFGSDRARAGWLAEQTGESFDRCHAAIRRHKAAK